MQKSAVISQGRPSFSDSKNAFLSSKNYDRQIEAFFYVKENGQIANKGYQELCNVKDRLATKELKDLVNKDVFKKIGTTGKGTYYVMKGTKIPK